MAETTSTRRTTSDNSWTITGASPATREKVRAAADAAGMTIRAWVDQTLSAAADGELVPRKGPAPVAVDPKTLADIVARLEDLQKRVPDDPASAERHAAQATSAAMLKVIASGMQEMQRAAKEQARIAEGKAPKKKRKKLVARKPAAKKPAAATPAANP